MNSANEQKPRLLVIADPNGAGKTTVTERGLAHEWFAGCRYVFRSIAQYVVIAPWVDRLYLYDNSIDGAEAALILRATEGKITIKGSRRRISPDFNRPREYLHLRQRGYS